MKYGGAVRTGLLLAVAVKAVLLGLLWWEPIFDERKAQAQDRQEQGALPQTGSEAADRRGCEQSEALRNALEAVAQKDRKLAQRERILAERESQIELAEKSLEAKIAELEEVERKLSATLDLLEQEGKAARESLAKIYSGMKPDEAARILSNLDEDTVMRIFAGMKERNISQILPLVDRELAVALTNRLARKTPKAEAAR